MPRPFTTPIDMTGLEIRNVLGQSLSSDPTPNSANAGRFWYDSANHLFKWSNGTIVVDPLSRANHSGSQSASTISDLATTVQAYKLNQFGAPTAAVAMGGQQFSGLVAASGSGQAIEYAQFQTALASLASGLDFKETAATVVATSNINTASPGTTISGHTMATGDTVLLAGQTSAVQNGLWSWNGSASAMTRRADASAAGSIVSGTMTVISGLDGSNPHSVWMQTSTGTGTGAAIVIGTDTQNWLMPFTAANYTAGNGINITTGVVTAVAGSNGGISVVTGGIVLDTTIAARKVSGTIASGTTTGTISHNLGNTCPQVVFRQAGQQIEVDNTATDGNTISYNFANATAATTSYMVIG